MSTPSTPDSAAVYAGIPPFGPVSNITPFTYRDGATYLQILEGLRVYITKTLVPFVTEEISRLLEDIDDKIQAIIDNDLIEDTVVAGFIEDANSLTYQMLDKYFVRTSDQVFNVKDFGAVGNGSTDDTAAITAAVNAAGTRPVYFPNGTYNFAETITAQTVMGENRQKTILVYTGSANAIGVKAPVVQSYHRRIENFTLRGSGFGYGLDIDSSSSGMYSRLLIDNFARAVYLHSSIGLPAQSLYNVFTDVTFQNATGYAVVIDDNSNENHFTNCRVNFAIRGFQINSGNHTVIDACSIENASERGISIPDLTPGLNLSRGTSIINCRFEFGVNAITISTGVQMTMVIANRFVSPLTYTDNGTGTFILHQESGSVGAAHYPTASRPVIPTSIIGAMIFDSTLGKPIWWNGTVWKDAAGTAV